MSEKIITKNRKASHEYHLFEVFEAGLELSGTEVKSLRNGKANIADGWVDISTGEAFLRDVSISPYSHGNVRNHLEKRPRKLLLKKAELFKLQKKIEERGMSIIPLSMYFKQSWAKVEIAVAKGKKLYDKRDSDKEKTAQRQMQRAMR